MKRMWSLNQLRNIADVQAKAVQKDISTLVDKDGHERFIEGEITLSNETGITKTYGKWALSGSHLLFVVAVDMLTDSGGSWIGNWASMDLPQWIKDKIVPSSAYTGSLVEYKSFLAWADDNSSQNIEVALRKENEGGTDRVFMSLNPPTLTKDRSVRIAFDLLIDNA